MVNLILAIILGVVFAYFAVQNSAHLLVNLSDNLITVPLYAVALGSLLVGVLISSLLSFAGWFSSALTISDKDHQLHKTERVIAQLQDQNKNLAIENAALRGETREVEAKSHLEQKIAHQQAHLEDNAPTSFWNRLRYKLAV